MPREISGAGGASPTLGALRIPPERVGRQCPPGRGSPPPARQLRSTKRNIPLRPVR